MTQDEIIEMAKQVGYNSFEALKWKQTLTDFAKLVADKEREACADICKKHADVYGAFESTPEFQAAWAACIDIRDAIRAKGEA